MKTLSFLSFLFAGATAAVQALDLTPVEANRDLEGFSIPIVVFRDGSRKISFQPPGDWRLSGGGAALSLYPRDDSSASVRFKICPVESGEKEKNEEGYLEGFARKLLPEDASDVALAGMGQGAFTLEGKGSREFSYTHASLGRKVRTSVFLVDFSDRERFAVIVTALSGDFDAARASIVSSMFSWTIQE